MEVFGTIVLFGFLTFMVGIILFSRHKKAELIHQERMTAMEKGVALPVFVPEAPAPDPIRRYLLSGMIWLFSGAALAFFLLALSATVPQAGDISPQESQAKIEVLRKLGADDDELRRVIYDQARRGPRIPIGLGTVGFIPMGVGLAYLIFYAAERRRYTRQEQSR
jgi:hypothetical protein